MFCGDDIGVAMPPTLPDQQIPKRSALINGSSGSKERIIGRQKVRTRVVDATFERNAAIT